MTYYDIIQTHPTGPVVRTRAPSGAVFKSNVGDVRVEDLQVDNIVQVQPLLGFLPVASVVVVVEE